MRGNRILLVISVLILMVAVAACRQKLDYTKEGPFIILTYQPAGPDDYRNLYPINYSIDVNGTLSLYTEQIGKRPEIGNDAPVFKKQLTDEDVATLKSLIYQNKFLELEEDISVDSEDGRFLYITVHLTDQSKKVGGLNPHEPRFMEIVDFIRSLVDHEEYMLWEEEINDYIYELNPGL